MVVRRGSTVLHLETGSNRGQFNKEIQVCFTSRTLVCTNSHQFESTKSLYRSPLEASNLYLQWYSSGFNQLQSVHVNFTTYTCKILHLLVVSLLNWPQVIPGGRSKTMERTPKVNSITTLEAFKQSVKNSPF